MVGVDVAGVKVGGEVLEGGACVFRIGGHVGGVVKGIGLAGLNDVGEVAAVGQGALGKYAIFINMLLDVVVE